MLFRSRHGAKVLIVDRDGTALERCLGLLRERLANDQGGKGAVISGFVADVTEPREAAAAVNEAMRVFGALNVLVNNAAVRYLSTVATADVAQWEKVLAVNVLGAVNMSRAALPRLREAGSAAIVNVSSTYALVGRGEFAAYDASKAALLSLTRSLAFEEAAHGIRVNAVCPGGTLTPFTVGRAQARGVAEAELRGQAKSDTLMRRWGEADEIAYPILWLASDEASFVTGATLAVDGGTSIM